MMKTPFTTMIFDGLKTHWERDAVSNYKGGVWRYGDLAQKICSFHYLLRRSGIRAGDRIAVCGRNSVNWGVVFLGTLTYGGVIVPILPEFNAEDIHHILRHSGSKLLFIDARFGDRLDPGQLDTVQAMVSLEGFEVLKDHGRHMASLLQESASPGFPGGKSRLERDDFKLREIPNDRLAMIVYTSGTTGFSKGVMLSHNSLAANVQFAMEELVLQPGQRMLSFMPLAHSYGCAFEFLLPLCCGVHVTFLSRIPSPAMIMEAFAVVRPHVIFSVPLIFEKMYKKKIVPMLQKPIMRAAMHVPGVSGLIRRRIRNRLTALFGGRFVQIVFGGAALNAEVELFLKQIAFPATVGYGLTECGPLVSYIHWTKHKAGSVGLPMTYNQVRIQKEHPEDTTGEIMVKGENVMDGYYRNPEATKRTLEPDGWLHTGDLGFLDDQGYLHIRGRSKNMILGPSGQNIYPEEIESRLNTHPLVAESLVLEKDGRLIALIVPDQEALDKHGLDPETLNGTLEEMRKRINERIPSYCRIVSIRVYPEEFQKTPTRKIKRYLYQSVV